MEFADPQCPYCADWAKTSLPTIVRRYVRTGKVRIVFDGMAFVGADSDTALRTALAAGRQGRFWNVIELLFENQGTENTGWVTDSLLRSIGAAVPGLDAQRMLDERTSSDVESALANAAVARAARRREPDAVVRRRQDRRAASARPAAEPRPLGADAVARRRPRRMSDRRLRAAILVLSALGAGIAAYLTVAHLAHVRVACATGGCETVQTSRYAELAGVPVAALGLAALPRPRRERRAPGPTSPARSASRPRSAGLAFAGYLLYVQAAVLGAYCQWCLASDALLCLLAPATLLRVVRADPPGG